MTTTASLESLQAVIAEVHRDVARAPEIRHNDPPIAEWTHVRAAENFVSLESKGIGPSPVELVASFDERADGSVLVCKVFRPGAHAVFAVLAAISVAIVWYGLMATPWLLCLLPIVAWTAVACTRLGGRNRQLARELREALSRIVAVAERMEATRAASPSLQHTTLDARPLAAVAEPSLIGQAVVASVAGAFFGAQFALAAMKHSPLPEEVVFARVGLASLFGALMGLSWTLTRDWRFLGRWTPLLRGVFVGEGSAVAVAQLGIAAGTVSVAQRTLVVSAGAAVGLLAGLWAESSEETVD